jgi:uncharacterized protein (TIGR03000 family)
MKKVLLIAALATTVVLMDAQWASAGRRGGCGGGCGGGGYCGGGYGGYCGGGYGGYGGYCGGGYCGGGYGGGYMMGGYGGGYCSIGGVGTTVVLGSQSPEATIVVALPADASLTIDDEPTTSTSANRVFVTPALEAGKDYQYTLKARIVRDGKTDVMTKEVTVRAGQVTQVELTAPAPTVAAQ